MADLRAVVEVERRDTEASVGNNVSDIGTSPPVHHGNLLLHRHLRKKSSSTLDRGFRQKERHKLLLSRLQKEERKSVKKEEKKPLLLVLNLNKRKETWAGVSLGVGVISVT
jgi:hypothetical protein